MRSAETDGGETPGLVIMGVHTSSEGYPNTKYRLQGLRRAFKVTEVSVPLRVGANGRVGVASRPLHGGWHALQAHIVVLLRYLFMKRPLRVYVPYPAVLILFLLSFLPRRLRPSWIVVDAFVSIYDTMVNDRSLLAPDSWRARLLLRFEQRAYKTADRVVVDTAENGVFYAQMFSLPDALFVPVPLATNETDYCYQPYRAGNRPCLVLFIGTLIPLHGITTILEAAKLLQHRPDIRFSIIGNGQEGASVQRALDEGLSNLDWDRTWKSPAELAAAISGSDICLGVFGATNKTQRVCPYKLYAYSSVGRAIVTADTVWLRNSTQSFGCAPFSAVPAADASALAERIAHLEKMPVERAELARNAHRFYVETLGNPAAISALTACLLEG